MSFGVISASSVAREKEEEKRREEAEAKRREEAEAKRREEEERDAKQADPAEESAMACRGEDAEGQEATGNGEGAASPQESAEAAASDAAPDAPGDQTDVTEATTRAEAGQGGAAGGKTTSLPDHWIRCHDSESNAIYYWNQVTGEVRTIFRRRCSSGCGRVSLWRQENTASRMRNHAGRPPDRPQPLGRQRCWPPRGLA